MLWPISPLRGLWVSRLLARRQEIDGLQREALTVRIIELIEVLDPQLDEAIEVDQREPPLLLRARRARPRT
jgi:hypothetical protein